uniref:Uncharacterized protein n=1 Tax=Romanomermis culicivorax TaxID=13658 RepID=A0A915HKK0_ROMCU
MQPSTGPGVLSSLYKTQTGNTGTFAIPTIRTIDRYYTNGTSILGDGTIIAGTMQADGSVLFPGEIKLTPDGRADYGRRTIQVTKILDGGLKLFPDKSILYPNDTLLTSDGHLIIPSKADYKPNMPKFSGLVMLYSNGSGILPNSTIIKGVKQPDGSYVFTQYEINVKKNGTAHYLGVASSEGTRLSDNTKKFFDNSFLFPNNSYLLPDGTLIVAKYANATTFEMPAVKGVVELFSNGTMIDQHNRVRQLKRTPHGNFLFEDEQIEVTPKGTAIYDGVRAKGAKLIDGAPNGYKMFEDESILLPNNSLLLDDGIMIVTKYAPSTYPMFIAKRVQYLFSNGTGVMADGSVLRGAAQPDGSFLFGNDIRVQVDGRPMYGGPRASGGKSIDQGYVIFADNSVLFPNNSLLLPDGTLVITSRVPPTVKRVQYLFSNGSGISPDGKIFQGIPGPNGIYLFPEDITLSSDGHASYGGLRATGGERTPGKSYTSFSDNSILFPNNSLLLSDGTLIISIRASVLNNAGGTVVLPPCQLHTPHCKDEIYTTSPLLAGESLEAELFICSCGPNERCSPSTMRPVQFYYSPQYGNQSGRRVAFVCSGEQVLRGVVSNPQPVMQITTLRPASMEPQTQVSAFSSQLSRLVSPPSAGQHEPMNQSSQLNMSQPQGPTFSGQLSMPVSQPGVQQQELMGQSRQLNMSQPQPSAFNGQPASQAFAPQQHPSIVGQQGQSNMPKPQPSAFNGQLSMPVSQPLAGRQQPVDQYRQLNMTQPQPSPFNGQLSMPASQPLTGRQQPVNQSRQLNMTQPQPSAFNGQLSVPVSQSLAGRQQPADQYRQLNMTQPQPLTFNGQLSMPASQPLTGRQQPADQYQQLNMTQPQPLTFNGQSSMLASQQQPLAYMPQPAALSMLKPQSPMQTQGQNFAPPNSQTRYVIQPGPSHPPMPLPTGYRSLGSPHQAPVFLVHHPGDTPSYWNQQPVPFVSKVRVRIYDTSGPVNGQVQRDYGTSDSRQFPVKVSYNGNPLVYG